MVVMGVDSGGNNDATVDVDETGEVGELEDNPASVSVR